MNRRAHPLNSSQMKTEARMYGDHHREPGVAALKKALRNRRQRRRVNRFMRETVDAAQRIEDNAGAQ